MLTSQTTRTLSELERHFDNYILDCQYAKQLSSKTIASYKDVFNTFRKIMPEIVALQDFHPQMIPEFFKRIATRKRIVGKNTVKVGVKPSTIKTYYNKLMAFFIWLEHSGELSQGFVKQISKPKNPTYDDSKALTDREASRILSSITQNTMDNYFLYLRDLIIVELLLYTGIRKGELLALKISDIDFTRNNIFINGLTSKSKHSRYIPLHFSLASHLKTYLKERQKLGSSTEALIISTIKDKALTEHGLKHWVNKYIKLSGVKFHLHRFRHTFACKLALENTDIITIMNVLGHRSVETTLRYLRSIKAENSREYIQQIVY